MGASGSKDSFTSLVQRLQETEVPPSEHEVWDELWKCSLSAEVCVHIYVCLCKVSHSLPNYRTRDDA